MTFTHQDIIRVRELAMESLKKMPSRVRIPGLEADLTTEDARWLAILDAATTVLNGKGFLRAEVVEHQPLRIKEPNSESIFS